MHAGMASARQQSRFIHSTVFGSQPTVEKPDYAKWMLEDPRINFAISQRGAKSGVDHLGFQVDSDEEFSALREHG